MESRYLQVIFLCVCYSLISSVQCHLRKPLNGTLQSKRLKSGPVFLIDYTTILVTQFSYDNGKFKNSINRHNKWFKGILRRGDNRTEFVDLTFMNSTNAQLLANLYLGLNMYLQVQENSQYDARHLSAIAIVNDKNEIKAAVSIDANDLLDLPEKDHFFSPKDNQTLFVYPKCCPLKSYLKKESDWNCASKHEAVTGSVERVPLYKNRGTQYDDEGLKTKDIIYEPFYYPINCSQKNIRVKLDSEDKFILLSNLEILVDDVKRPQAHCLDFYPDKNHVFHEAVYVCLSDMDVDMNKTDIFNLFSSSAPTATPTVLLLLSLFLCLK
ncbi:uncharacterized protein [Atheta coriaria]|uniref:uncharacterized protein n=1 Tax=Dalotia coriaria TaxID=877792 RepID=UPI0031F3425E